MQVIGPIYTTYTEITTLEIPDNKEKILLGEPYVTAQKHNLDNKASRLDEFGDGFAGINSRVQPGQIVVAALGFKNIRVSDEVRLVRITDEATLQIAKNLNKDWLHEDRFLAYYALSPRMARKLGLL